MRLLILCIIDLFWIFTMRLIIRSGQNKRYIEVIKYARFHMDESKGGASLK